VTRAFAPAVTSCFRVRAWRGCGGC
jgi:hypothetical protein